ncbi:MAG: hypothetical protein ACLP05_06170 [Candidatus Kryptoniota bacterium]
MRHLKYLPIVIVFASLSFNGCTSSLLVKSDWNENKIVIDGKDNDWDDTMFYIPDAELTAGVHNDSNYLYIILKTTNRMQTFQVLGSGLTVWFDRSGGTSQNFGIHFPLGRGEGGEMSQPSSSEGSSTSSADNPDEDTNQTSSFVDMMPNELEILGVNENGPVRLTIADVKGIELQMSHNREGLIYEMKVPLHTSPDHPYAINPKSTSVGVEFVTGKFKARSQGEGMERHGEGEGEGSGGEGGGEGIPGEGGMGGYGGMRGGGGGRGRHFGGENGGQPPKQIDFWLKVKLASSSGQ